MLRRGTKRRNSPRIIIWIRLAEHAHFWLLAPKISTRQPRLLPRHGNHFIFPNLVPSTGPQDRVQGHRLFVSLPERVQITQSALHTLPNRAHRPLDQQTVAHRTLLPLHFLILGVHLPFFAVTVVMNRPPDWLNRHSGNHFPRHSRHSLGKRFGHAH